MSWIKRNLYFLIGGAVALALLGLAGYYCYSQWTLNNKNWEVLNEAYQKLDRISKLPINPGNDKVDNIKNAQEDERRLRAVIDKTKKFFVPVPSIPNLRRVGDQEFASALRRTIDQLEREAAAASVKLPPNYNFSFEAQRQRVVFAAGSPPRLAAQLGDIKAICDILFAAKINALDNVRRERISSDDAGGTQSDYLEMTSVTNYLAVLTPYEVSFRCFSGELAKVLAGFANEPHAFIVKTINVLPSSLILTPDMVAAMGGSLGNQPGVQPAPGAPGYVVNSPYAANPAYAGNPYGPYAGNQPYTGNPYGPYAGNQPYTAQPVMTVTKGGLPVVLDEKEVRVSLVVIVVKLLPKT